MYYLFDVLFFVKQVVNRMVNSKYSKIVNK